MRRWGMGFLMFVHGPTVLRVGALWLVLAAMLVGCGDDDVEAGDGNVDEGSAVVDENADPPVTELEVIELAATIGPDGGTMEGSGVDGFEGFQLVIPAGALDAEQDFVVRSVMDGVPLPSSAAAIGPQFEILPAGVTFATPASLQVPFDASLRSRWEVGDDECRVWQRDGEGWSRLDQIASTPETVTVELGATTTVGAGVFAIKVPIGCRFGCQPAAPPERECLNGSRLCIESIGSAHTYAPFDSFNYTKGLIYWLSVPRSGQVALSSFDVLSRRPGPTTSSLVVPRSVAMMGDVVVDDAGDTWVGISGVGNVRFPQSGLPTAFDTSSSARGIGVTFDRNFRQVVRHRLVSTFRSDINRSGADLIAARGSLMVGRIFIDGRIAAAEAFGQARALSAPPGSIERVTYATNVGMFQSDLSLKNYFFVTASGTCGGGPLTTFFSGSASVSQTQNGSVSICGNQANGGALVPYNIDFAPNQRPAGVTAISSTGVTYLAHFDRPQLTVFAGGGVTVVPLTDARIDDPEYERRIPEAIYYDTGLDTLYLVSRGDGTLREFYAITDL